MKRFVPAGAGSLSKQLDDPSVSAHQRNALILMRFCLSPCPLHILLAEPRRNRTLYGGPALEDPAGSVEEFYGYTTLVLVPAGLDRPPVQTGTCRRDRVQKNAMDLRDEDQSRPVRQVAEE